MVNPILSANSTAVTVLSALIGNNTANTPAITSGLNPEPNNFKALISNLFSKENSQLAKEVNSNEKIKASLYQAAAMISLTGNAGNIAALDTQAISKDTIVSSIMQNNNLTTAERAVFLKALKTTAVEIVINSAAKSTQPEPAVLTDGTQAAANVKPTVTVMQAEPQEVSPQTKTAPSTDPAPIGQTKTINVKIISAQITTAAATQAPAGVKDLSSPEAALAVKGDSIQVTAKQPQPAINTQPENILTSTPPAAGVQAAPVSLAEKIQPVEQALGLVRSLENELISISVSTAAAPETKQAAADSLKVLQAVKIKIEEVRDAVGTGVKAQSNSAALKDAISGIITSLNNIAIALPAPVTAAVQPVVSNVSDDQTTGGAIALNLLSQGNQGNQQGGKFAVTTSGQPQEFKSIVAKIVALLNELNGSLTVTNKPVYAPRPDIALQMAVNTPAFQQIKTAQVVLPQDTPAVQVPDAAHVVVVADNNAPAVIMQTNQVNEDIVQTAVVLPQAVTLKTQADTNAIINAPEQAKVSAIAAPEAVQTAAKVLFDKLGTAKQDTPSKSLVSDVRWISDNIVKPAALSNEAAVAFVSGNETIFDRVAAFADSIKEQIVMRQVVSKISDQSGQKVNEIKMVLKPENLGSVYIKLEHTNGEIKGTIQVTNDSVKDTLKASLPELKAALGSIGMTVNNFDISMANSNTSSDFQGQGRNNFSQWQAAAQQVAAENTDGGVDSFVNADGYLNYLA